MAVSLTPRERRRLREAHESGQLDATCRDNRAVVKAHGLWCWRLKLPMVWFERHSPRSRFGRLHLDMLTTPHMLTGAGQAALKALGAAEASPHEVLWEGVPLSRLDRLAHAAFRAAVQAQHYRLNRSQLVKIDSRSRKPLKLAPRKIASAS
jgi:hypothetical protein